MMTCNIVVLFTNDSERLAMELAKRFDNVSINAICMSNLTHSHQRANIGTGTKAKIHVIFFSPEFLKFLENSPLDAYNMCGHLEASSTVAVFCQGLKAKDVLCYHMAPLKSFWSWTKFEVVETLSEQYEFPQELLDRIQEVTTEDDYETVEIVVVPHFLKRHNRTIHVIFSCPIDELKDVKVILSDRKEIDICLEKMNPYVIKFCVPDSLFQFSHNVIIRVATGGRILKKQTVHLSQDSPKRSQDSPKRSQLKGKERNSVRRLQASTREELQLDEQLKFLSDFSGLTQDREDTITTTDLQDLAVKFQKTQANRSKTEKTEDTDLSEFCEQYGLEKLSRLITDASLLLKEDDFTSNESSPKVKKQTDKGIRLRRDSLSVSECLLPEMDSSNRMKSFLIEDSDINRLRGTSRSLSLPSTLIPTSDGLESFETYLDMKGTEQPEMKPHEKLLASLCSADKERAFKNGEADYRRELLESLSSDRYVSLMLSGEDEIDVRALLKKGLSDSQQELLDLLHGFKEGDCTISHAEKQFQLWREKHCVCYQSPRRTNKTSVFALPWRKPKKKISKERKDHPLEFCSSKISVLSNLNQSKDRPKPDMNSKQDDEVFSRKISGTSASSSVSSKASEASNVTAPFRGEENTGNEPGFDESSILTAGWVSSYSPTSNRRYCSLYPEKSHPVLPTRPPTLPRRPPPSPNQSVIVKPKPLPRRNVPSHVIKETTLNEVIVEEKVPILQQSPTKEPNEEDKNANIVDLCQKYGLESLGECFVSGTCLSSEKQSDSGRKESSRLQSQDSDGYECPLKRTFRIRDEISDIATVRRSSSLPCDLNQSFEFPENIELDPSRFEALYAAETPPENTCNCENCYSITDSFTSNIYMSLLEFRRDNDVSSKQGMCKDLSSSQQELLDLMYAFKRGDKTISQVEQQFQDWHSRHMGTTANFVMGSSANKCKYEKVRKQSSFGLPGLKNFILGKPRKKNSNESKHSEFDTEIRRVKKNSETSNSSNKRLSKLSCTSNSSASSELSEVFRTTKDNRRSAEGNVQVTPPVCPKRPPPMPPNKPLPTHGLGEQSQARRASEGKTESPTIIHPKTQKPIPPPKPKLLFKPKPAGLSECQTPASKTSNKTEELPQNHDEDACARPASPDYIVPNMHKVPRTARKKTPDVKCINMAEKCLRNFPRLRLGSESDPITRIMINRQPSSPTLANKSAKSSIPSATRAKMSPPCELALHPQTLELLKKANLLNISDEKASMFYIRRSSSYPNVRVSEIRRQPIYLQILRPVSKNARRSSLFTNNAS